MRFQRHSLVRFGAAVAFVGLAAACSLGFGQVQVMVEYDSQMWPVIAMDGQYPVIDSGGERQRVFEGRVALEPANTYTDGGLEVLARDASMGPDYGSAYGNYYFRFEAAVRADRDFEDCFILFAVTPEEGDASYVMRQIPDLSGDTPQRILITMPVNPGFGGGTFFYLIFSKGEEIQVRDSEELVMIRKNEDPVGESAASAAPSASRTSSGSSARRVETYNSTPVKVIDAKMPDFPKSLVGVVQGGYAEAMFSIGEDGRVFEILDVKADRPEFVPEMVKAIVGSTYQPGRYNGEPLATTVVQKFFFNEFASFPEAMENVPYPSLRDRAPLAVYAPLPKKGFKTTGVVKIELLVDTLGRPKEPRIVSSPSDELSNATLDAARNWQFLPGIKDRYPTPQRVEIPVEFKL